MTGIWGEVNTLHTNEEVSSNRGLQVSQGKGERKYPCPGRACSGWTLPSNFIRVTKSLSPLGKNKQNKTYTYCHHCHSVWPKKTNLRCPRITVEQCAPTTRAEQEQSDHKSTENSFFVQTTEKLTSDNEKILYQLTNETKPLFWMGLEVTRQCPLRNNDIKGVKSPLPACSRESGSLDRPQ